MWLLSKSRHQNVKCIEWGEKGWDVRRGIQKKTLFFEVQGLNNSDACKFARISFTRDSMTRRQLQNWICVPVLMPAVCRKTFYRLRRVMEIAVHLAKLACTWRAAAPQAAVICIHLLTHTRTGLYRRWQTITWKPFGLRLRGFSEATFSFPSTTFIRLSVFLTYCRSLYVRRSSTSIDWLMFWTCRSHTDTHR